MLDYSDALEIWLGSVRLLDSEQVDVAAGSGRVLARDVRADVALPPFATSAMDGWAVRLRDLGVAGGDLPVSARIAAAPGEPGPLEPGTAAKVMTGAPVPAGTEGIVPVESAEDRGARVRLLATPSVGDHIRRAGEVFRSGDLLAPAGRMVRSRDVALLAAGFAGPLVVQRRPRAAILVTGDELVPPGVLPGPGQIRNSNGAFLSAAVREEGGEVTFFDTARDDREELRERFRLALATDPAPDLIVTSGGVSMGDYDLVSEMVSSLGARILFHRVNIKPAKPVLAATFGDTLFLGLPGNPVSVAVSWELFARPAIRKMGGRPALAPVEAFLSAPARNRARRLGFVDAELRVEGARLVVCPLPSKGSHDLLSHARANALAVLPPGSDLAEGTMVRVVPLDSALLR